MKTMIILFLAGSLLLAGCSSQQKIDDAVASATSQLTARVATLEDQVRSVTAERDACVANATGLQTSAQAASSQLTTIQKTLQQQKATMNDLDTELQTCKEKRDALSEKNVNLTKKTEVLQKWVDACQETLGTLG